MVVGNHSLKWFETYGNNVENEKNVYWLKNVSTAYS